MDLSCGERWRTCSNRTESKKDLIRFRNSLSNLGSESTRLWFSVLDRRVWTTVRKDFAKKFIRFCRPLSNAKFMGYFDKPKTSHGSITCWKIKRSVCSVCSWKLNACINRMTVRGKDGDL
jgi:hypothetical protein